MRAATLLIVVALIATDLHAQSAKPTVADSLVFRFHEAWGCFPCSLVQITGKYGYFTPPVALALAAGDNGYFGGGAYRQIHLQRGKLYALSAWVNGDLSSPDFYVVISVSNEFFRLPQGLQGSRTGHGWEHLGPWLFMEPEIYPPGTALYLGVETRSNSGTAAGRWLVGQIEIDEVEPD